MASLSLNPVVDVVVQVSPLSAPRRAFDTGLIIGPNTIIPAADRLVLYEDTNAMLSAGFTKSDPEYKAALLYFGQSPTPRKLMVGMRLSQSILTIAIGAGGTGYKVGDILTITGGTGGTARVKTIGTDGIVTAVTLVSGGTGYTVSTGKATTVAPAGGTGCTINIVTVGMESCSSAVTACRMKNTEWYAVSCLGATKADILEVAAYVETAAPTSVQFYTTADADVPTNGDGNIKAALKALGYSKTIGQYSTTPYAIVSIMGYAMRNNTGLANSCYTLKFKKEPGVVVESLDATQVLNIENNNGNLYINRGYYYDMFEQGVMANGQFFDEIINLDMLANRIQLNIMDKLYKAPKIAQTEQGVTQLISACNEACDRSVTQGFLAPGKWTGQPVLNLNTGDTLQSGYLVQAEAINDQDEADREARKSPPIYVSIKEAGAMHSATIGVYVSR
jgi:hypothetical protein